jgi:hypothetical protein
MEMQVNNVSQTALRFGGSCKRQTANGKMYCCLTTGSAAYHSEVVGGAGEKKKERMTK